MNGHSDEPWSALKLQAPPSQATVQLSAASCVRAAACRFKADRWSSLPLIWTLAVILLMRTIQRQITPSSYTDCQRTVKVLHDKVHANSTASDVRHYCDTANDDSQPPPDYIQTWTQTADAAQARCSRTTQPLKHLRLRQTINIFWKCYQYTGSCIGPESQKLSYFPAD